MDLISEIRCTYCYIVNDFTRNLAASCRFTWLKTFSDVESTWRHKAVSIVGLLRLRRESRDIPPSLFDGDEGEDVIGMCIALSLSLSLVDSKKGPTAFCLLSLYRDESHFVDIPDRSLKDYLGYISTWSGFRTYSKTNDGEKLLHDFAKGYILSIIVLTLNPE